LRNIKVYIRLKTTAYIAQLRNSVYEIEAQKPRLARKKDEAT